MQFPTLLTALTFATLGLEVLGPFLLFFPFFTGPVRTIAILAFISFYYGIWLTLYIGIFPWISAFCMGCFLPGWFWYKVAKLRAALPDQPRLTRTLRHTATHLAHAYWLPLRARLSSVAGVGRTLIAAVATQDEPGSHVERTAPATSVTETERQKEAGSAAMATTGEGSNVAEESRPVTLRSSLVTNLLALFFLIYVFCWNLSTVSEFKMPEGLVPLGHALGSGRRGICSRLTRPKTMGGTSSPEA